jgi:predicted nucleic acid-binding protein
VAKIDKATAKVAAKHAAVLRAEDKAAAERTEEKAAEERALSSLTVVELRARAREQGRSGYSRLNKAGLVELLSA